MSGKKKRIDVKKNDTSINTVKENKTDIVFFQNSPIKDKTNDVFDFSIKATAIENAIDNGANLIALIGDYGTGKSSLTNILYDGNKEKYAEPIYINLWDSLTTIEGKDGNTPVSYFTKSFLYQLALGNQNHNHFSRYINQRLSKNYGKLSFALAKKRTLGWIITAGISVVLFFIFGDNLLPNTLSNLFLTEGQTLDSSILYKGLQFFGSVRYLLLLLTGFCLYESLKNNNILFSLWDSQGKIEPTDTDCFEVFEEIISNITKKCNKKKQLIIIEDLDRSDNAKVVLSLLKRYIVLITYYPKRNNLRLFLLFHLNQKLL